MSRTERPVRAGSAIAASSCASAPALLAPGVTTPRPRSMLCHQKPTSSTRRRTRRVVSIRAAIVTAPTARPRRAPAPGAAATLVAAAVPPSSGPLLRRPPAVVPVMGDFLLSWLAVPALLSVLSLGAGLLVAAIASRGGGREQPFPAVLAMPIGFAALVVLASLLTTWKATTSFSGPAAIVFALAGFIAGRRLLRDWLGNVRAIAWPLLAAILPAASVGAPVVLTGHAGMTGFGKITDLAHQISFIEWLRLDGRTQIGHGNSSFQEIVDKLVSSNYPGGT